MDYQYANAPIADVAEDFNISFLPDLISHNKKVEVNMDHISGWVTEEDGSRSHFMPTVQFHPFVDKAKDLEGFKILIFNTELVEPEMETANVFTFLKDPDLAPDSYLAKVDENDYLLEEQVTIPSDECCDLEVFPPIVAGYDNNPFKTLESDPTAE